MTHFLSSVCRRFLKFNVGKLGAKFLSALRIIVTFIQNSLLGVKPSLGIWTPEAICLMKKLVQNKIITVKVVDKLENSSLVELIDKSETPHVSVSRVLIDAGFAVGEQRIVTDKPSDMKEDSGKSDVYWIMPVLEFRRFYK